MLEIRESEDVSRPVKKFNQFETILIPVKFKNASRCQKLASCQTRSQDSTSEQCVTRCVNPPKKRETRIWMDGIYYTWLYKTILNILLILEQGSREYIRPTVEGKLVRALLY